MLPSSSSAANAQPHLASSGVGPSSTDPSEYAVPSMIPSAGSINQLKVSRGETFCIGLVGLGRRALSHAGCPSTSQLEVLATSPGAAHFFPQCLHALGFAFPNAVADVPNRGSRNLLVGGLDFEPDVVLLGWLLAQTLANAGRLFNENGRGPRGMALTVH